MALMRARVSPLGRHWRDSVLPVGLGMAGIAGLALATARQPVVTLWFLGGSLALLGLLGALGAAVRRIAQRLPRPERPLLRLALANLHRPGAQTGALVTALGFGLSAFVLLAAVQTSLDANIAARVPNRAPDYFVLDLPRGASVEDTDRSLQTLAALIAPVAGTTASAKNQSPHIATEASSPTRDLRSRSPRLCDDVRLASQRDWSGKRPSPVIGPLSWRRNAMRSWAESVLSKIACSARWRSGARSWPASMAAGSRCS